MLQLTKLSAITCWAPHPGHVTKTTPFSYALFENDLTDLVSHFPHVYIIVSFGTVGEESGGPTAFVQYVYGMYG